MKFLGLFARSAIGSAAATFLFTAALIMLAIGVLPIIPLAIQAAFTGVVFGLVYSLVHIKREPTFLSSFGTGVGYLVLMTIVSILAGTFAGITLGSLIGTLVMALLLGGGAYLATRVGR